MNAQELEQQIADLERGGWRHFRAVRRLRRGDPHTVQTAMCRVLQEHPSSQVQAAAALLTVWPGLPVPVPLLLRALQADDGFVRAAAASALSRAGTSDILEELAGAAERCVIRARRDPVRAPFEEWYPLRRILNAIARVAETGTPPARCWALSFVRSLAEDAPLPLTAFAETIARLEKATAGDLPRPAGPPSGKSRNLPRASQDAER